MTYYIMNHQCLLCDCATMLNPLFNVPKMLIESYDIDRNENIKMNEDIILLKSKAY